MKNTGLDRILVRNRRHRFLDVGIAAILVVGFALSSLAVAFQVNGARAPVEAAVAVACQPAAAPVPTPGPVGGLALR